LGARLGVTIVTDLRDDGHTAAARIDCAVKPIRGPSIHGVKRRIGIVRWIQSVSMPGDKPGSHRERRVWRPVPVLLNGLWVYQDLDQVIRRLVTFAQIGLVRRGDEGCEALRGNNDRPIVGGGRG
jgi:hypothetical protein